MRSIKVYYNDIIAGMLSKLDNGKYSFRYEDEYFCDKSMPEISITLPKSCQEFVSDSIFPFFTNMLPEGGNRKVICRQFKVDETDFFGMLLAMRGADFIGAINLR